MNDDSLNDPQLKSLEARLAAAVPLTSTAQQQRLLYECAFAAGRSAAGRTLRRWQATVAALAVLLAGVSVPLAREHSLLAKRPVERPASGGATPRQTPIPRDDPAVAIRQPAAVALDAWQVQPPAAEAFPKEFAQFRQADPRLRSVTLGALSREILAP